MKLTVFKDINFLPAVKVLFKELNVPMNNVADEPTTAKEILKDTYKDNSTFQLIDDVYFVGMVDDAAFEGNNSLEVDQIKSDYDGILIFGITLHPRENNLLPNRSQLAEISRAFNREFYYTPVVLVFKYRDDKADYLAFANTERLQYKQAWREGEKAGKVSLLRDIDIQKPHRGHEDIIEQLCIPTSGSKVVDSFAKLYTYWQEVFSVNVLNKKFYQELSNWYFWAINHVTFPSKPTLEIAHQKGAKLEDMIKEHNATNVIRLLTRLLFTWFIKEKKLIPEELFDLNVLQKNILNEISPYHEVGMFALANKDSVYYRAILQNLFFASLNCPIEPDGVDNRSRGFRGDGYGTHRGIDYLMRYKKYFKDPDAFLQMMNQTVPFLNGGLFECLDDKYQNLYIDGFSDQMTKGEQLIVPDYLFFGVEEQVDLSTEYGVSNNGTKQAAVKGLINILKSYKFTITENTPIEEDVALDPELLGKVFENLLASYNPETKTTARKQTGSFYTPREIVNYMVDESLIAYLKNAVDAWGLEEKEQNEKLHQLTSFDPINPFAADEALTRNIVTAIDQCKILDPACGSGAFPMGILQKMVHMLQKLDPENKIWKEVQRQKVLKETEQAFEIEDKKEREEKLIEINNAFDERMNDPDYARKLYLIENCIYGVDIQPIATQIAKLRFFISLVVDQKKNDEAPNFGIRPLPNLETKFVTANTLIDIEKPKEGQTLNIFSGGKVDELEKDLKKVRHKLFSARTKETKLKYRQKDEELRHAIAEELKSTGWPNEAADKLAKWNPYDQNASSTFFNPEWMFDISEGFDVVIGNPPYGFHQIHSREMKNYFKKMYHSSSRSFESYFLFYEKSLSFLKPDGSHSFIVPVTWLTIPSAFALRQFILDNFFIEHISWLNDVVFSNAQVNTLVSLIRKNAHKNVVISKFNNASDLNEPHADLRIPQQKFIDDNYYISIFENTTDTKILNLIKGISTPLDQLYSPCSGYNPYEVGKGIAPGGGVHTRQTIAEKPYHSNVQKDEAWKPEVVGRDLSRYGVRISGDRWVKYGKWLSAPRDPNNFLGKRILVQEIVGGPERRITAAYFDGELYHSRDVIPIKVKPNSPHPFILLAILNSALLSWYHNKRSPKAKKGLFPKVLVSDLKKFPIIIPSEKSNIQLLIFLVEIILYLNSEKIKKAYFRVIDEIIDAVVFNLYFPDHMKERGIDVLELVEQDIGEIMQEYPSIPSISPQEEKIWEFVKLSDTEKEKVIEQLYQTWSHPDNKVRNRIKLFAVRSPEILKPILEN